LPAGVLAAAEPPPSVKIVRVPLKPVQIASQPGGAANPQSELDSLYRQGRYQEVISAAAKAIQAAPRAKALYVTLANAHYQLGQYAQAAEAAQRHLDLCPHCSWALGRLASCRVALGAPEEAIQVLDQALQAHPTVPGPCNELAWIYVSGPDQVRNPEKALPLAQKAVALAPTNRNYQNTLGVVYYRLGTFDKAVNTLLGASQPGTAKSTEALNQLFLAMSYHQLGEFARAKKCFAQAPRPSPAERLDRHTIEQLQATRAEAAALLGIE
jgi:tetratricopeptide (TPR) repeat protein